MPKKKTEEDPKNEEVVDEEEIKTPEPTPVHERPAKALYYENLFKGGN